MNREEYERLFQESEEEWAEINKRKIIRQKKDERIISSYCAENIEEDILNTVELLLKYRGMAGHDKETVEEFKKMYPDKLNVPLLRKYMDLLDIFEKYLESGGEKNE